MKTSTQRRLERWANRGRRPVLSLLTSVLAHWAQGVLLATLF